MKFQDFFDKVKDSDDFKKFSSEKPEAYLCAGFFILDLKDNKNEASVDFFNPSDKKITSFKFGEKITAIPLEVPPGMNKNDIIPEKINSNPEVELEELKGIIQDEMHNRGMTYDIQKIIAVLQNLDGKLIWNCTSLLSGLALLKTHIEDLSKSVILMEKSSLLDLIRPVQVKPGQDPKEAIQQAIEAEKNKIDPEKAEGNQEGFIG